MNEALLALFSCGYERAAARSPTESLEGPSSSTARGAASRLRPPDPGRSRLGCGTSGKRKSTYVCSASVPDDLRPPKVESRRRSGPRARALDGSRYAPRAGPVAPGRPSGEPADAARRPRGAGASPRRRGGSFLGGADDDRPRGPFPGAAGPSSSGQPGRCRAPRPPERPGADAPRLPGERARERPRTEPSTRWRSPLLRVVS